MKKIITALLVAFSLMATGRALAEGEAVRLYIIPIEQNGNARGPEYFTWRFDANPPSIDCRWNMMDYGFLNYGLLVAHDITPEEHASVISHADVYAFPDNLDAPITDRQVIDGFFESISIPTDWLTPSTTYRELLRYMAGMFQFNQRYGGISGGQSIFGNGVTLETSWNNLSSQQKDWFNATIQSFGYGFSVQGNPKLRQLAKQAGDLWGDAPFVLGGYEF